MRYYVCNADFMPLPYQPDEGYTLLGAINRIYREIDDDIRLFGGTFKDHKPSYHVMDDKMRYLKRVDIDI